MSEGLVSLLNALKNVAKEVDNIVNKEEVKNFLINVSNGLHKLGELTYQLYSYGQEQKKMNIEMSQYGWFPSHYTFKTPVLECETADEYMERCLDENYSDIKQLIFERYPHRKHIFEEAFLLFEEHRYIAAIPLYISQLDGLSAEYGLSPFFTDDRPINLSKTEKKNLSEEDKIKFEKFPKYLRNALNKELLGQNQNLISYYEEVISNACESFIGMHTEKLDMSNPINILNRHGILHGHVNFVEYGNRINCMKIISLVLFVDHILHLLYNSREIDNINEEKSSLLDVSE